MEPLTLTILMIMDQPEEQQRLAAALQDDPTCRYVVHRAATLGEGRQRLLQTACDAIIVDSGLREVQSVELLYRVRCCASNLPLLALTDEADEDLALQAIQQGAHECLVRGRLSPADFRRAVRRAIERERARAMMDSLCLFDELTGLYNRRGLAVLASKELQQAERAKRHLCVLYVDLNGLKSINDRFGHLTGDQALADTAGLLRRSFRGGDVLARVGGDEFVVVAVEGEAVGFQRLPERLQENARRFNASSGRPYALSISIGSASYAPGTPSSIEDLLDEADRQMYKDKRSRSQTKVIR